MMTFGNPAASILFLIIPLVALFWFWKEGRIKLAVGRWISPELQSRLVRASSRQRVWIEFLLLSSVLALMVIALMDPRGNPRYLATHKSEEKGVGEILFLIDASASMKTLDTRTGQSRFEIAKEIAQQTIEQLSGNTIGLFAFTSELTPLSPPTLELLFVHMMVNQLEINAGDVTGTSLLNAFEQLLPTLEQNNAHKVVVLLSDGENTEPESAEALNQAIDKMLQAKATLQVVGVGSNEGAVIPGVTWEGKPVVSVPNLNLLKQIAARGRGGYLNGSGNSSLAIATELAHDIRADNSGAVAVGSETISEVVYTHYRTYPIVAALVLVLLYWFTPLLSLFAVLCCFQPALYGDAAFAHAMYQLEAGDLPQAVREWTSLVATKKTPWEHGVALYNLGYAFLLQEQWQDAVNTLDMIPLTKDTPQYLSYHVEWNKAWANFKLGNPPDLILKMIDKSEESYCEWMKAIGAKDCNPPPRYENFRKLVKATPYQREPAHAFVYDPDPVVILKQVVALLEQDNLVEVMTGVSAFEFRSLEVQKEKFFTTCQFHPWNEVYPPFYQGVMLLRRNVQDQVLQAKALLKFREALEKLTQPPEKFKGSCWGGSNPNLLQQLQSMNMSDRQPAQKQKVKEGNKPW